jgi:hypothetical protein
MKTAREKWVMRTRDKQRDDKTRSGRAKERDTKGGWDRKEGTNLIGLLLGFLGADAFDSLRL